MSRQPSFTHSLLFELFDRVVGFATYGSRGPFVASVGTEAYERIMAAHERSRVHSAIQQLKRQCFVVVDRDQQRIQIRLTRAGALAILRNQIMRKKKLLPEGRLCVVSFDFPVAERRSRAAFRSVLRDAEFTCRHQSVWVSTRDVMRELVLFVNATGVQERIQVYLAMPMS